MNKFPWTEVEYEEHMLHGLHLPCGWFLLLFQIVFFPSPMQWRYAMIFFVRLQGWCSFYQGSHKVSRNSGTFLFLQGRPWADLPLGGKRLERWRLSEGWCDTGIYKSTKTVCLLSASVPAQCMDWAFVPYAIIPQMKVECNCSTKKKKK